MSLILKNIRLSSSTAASGSIACYGMTGRREKRGTKPLL
jgi:hypothetical protein